MLIDYIKNFNVDLMLYFFYKIYSYIIKIIMWDLILWINIFVFMIIRIEFIYLSLWNILYKKYRIDKI